MVDLFIGVVNNDPQKVTELQVVLIVIAVVLVAILSLVRTDSLSILNIQVAMSSGSKGYDYNE